MKEKNRYLKLLTEAGIEKTVLDAIACIDRPRFFDKIFADQVYTLDQIPIGAGQKSDDPVLKTVKKAGEALGRATGGLRDAMKDILKKE